MLDFRKYKDLIRKQVAAISKKDPNWKWTVVSITKRKVAIKWGYLVYCGCENDCFFLTVNDDEKDDYGWISSRTPENSMIDGYFVAEVPSDPKNGHDIPIESGIRYAVNDIYEHASNRY